MALIVADFHNSRARSEVDEMEFGWRCVSLQELLCQKLGPEFSKYRQITGENFAFDMGWLCERVVKLDEKSVGIDSS